MESLRAPSSDLLDTLRSPLCENWCKSSGVYEICTTSCLFNLSGTTMLTSIRGEVSEMGIGLQLQSNENHG